MLLLGIYFFTQVIINDPSERLLNLKNGLIFVLGSTLIMLYAFFDLKELNIFRVILAIWNVFLILLAGYNLWQGYRDDLNKPRTVLRLTLTVDLALYVIIVSFVSGTQPLNEGSYVTLLTIEGALLAVLGFFINTILVQPSVFSSVFAVDQASEDAKIPLARQLDELEVMSVKIKTLMEKDQLFLAQGLTLQELAKRSEIPAYRLRYLLNQHLGHENFSSFLNPYRLRHAALLLTTPDRRGDKVFALALESGFSSLAPFNKAFKAMYGVTPSEYLDTNSRPLPASK